MFSPAYSAMMKSPTATINPSFVGPNSTLPIFAPVPGTLMRKSPTLPNNHNNGLQQNNQRSGRNSYNHHPVVGHKVAASLNNLPTYQNHILQQQQQQRLLVTPSLQVETEVEYYQPQPSPIPAQFGEPQVGSYNSSFSPPKPLSHPPVNQHNIQPPAYTPLPQEDVDGRQLHVVVSPHPPTGDTPQLRRSSLSPRPPAQPRPPPYPVGKKQQTGEIRCKH